MGTVLDDEIIDGDFDNFCWLTSAFFNPENPPKFLTVEISGLLKGDLWVPPDLEPRNGQFVLEQTNTTEWGLFTAAIIMSLAWSSFITGFKFTTFTVGELFPFDGTSSTCQTLLSNSFTLPAGRHFYSGTVRALGVN